MAVFVSRETVDGTTKDCYVVQSIKDRRWFLINLGPSVPLIGIQFAFSNYNAIPAGVPEWREEETVEAARARKTRANGRLVIEPTENCELADFVSQLEGVGYELVSAYVQERRDPSKPKAHYTAHFMFAHTDCANPSEEFMEYRADARGALKELLETCFWRVRAFLNPFYDLETRAIMDGKCHVSLNCEVRVPLFRADGTRVTQWRRDEHGEKIGDAPEPLKPSYRLCADPSRSEIVLEPVT